MGRKEIAEAAGASNRFLDRPVKAIDKDTGHRRRPDRAAPHGRGARSRQGQATDDRASCSASSRSATSVDRYFDKYRSSQTHISTILGSLANGKDELLMDNAAIDTERAEPVEDDGQARADDPHLQERSTSKLEDKANELDATDPAKAKAIRETALFYTRQRTTDLLTQMAVTVQGYLALDLVKKNNVELVKGVDRASTTTVSRAAHRGHRRPGDDQPEAGARADHRAQHDHRGHDRFAPASCCRTQTGAIHEQAASLDDPAGDAAARLPEHLRHDGPDRPRSSSRRSAT